ncbi:MAG: glycosyltransferase [Actinomycetota bacterium]
MTLRIITTHSDGNPLVVGLRSIGVRVDRVSWTEMPGHRDFDGCIGFYGNLFTEIKNLPVFVTLKHRLARLGIPYVFWNRDAPWNVGMKLHRRLAVQWLKPVDIYLAHSLQDARWFSGNCHYFPNAAQRPYYAGTRIEEMRVEDAYEADVCFFGALGNLKRRGCRERVEFFGEVERRVKALLPTARFRIVDTVHQGLGLEEQLHLIRTSKINLNFGAMCDLPGNPSWGMPERVFGIPAAGGFLLTDYRQAIPDTFTDGACDYFLEAEDCAAKIVSGLASFSTLRARAEEMYRQVVAQHTYEVRANQLLDLLGLYREHQPIGTIQPNSDFLSTRA